MRLMGLERVVSKVAKMVLLLSKRERRKRDTRKIVLENLFEIFEIYRVSVGRAPALSSFQAYSITGSFLGIIKEREI